MSVDAVLCPVEPVPECVEEGITSFLEGQECNSSNVVFHQLALNRDTIVRYVSVLFN